MYGVGQVWNIDIAILILSKEFTMIRLYMFLDIYGNWSFEEIKLCLYISLLYLLTRLQCPAFIHISHTILDTV